ncbi:MAG TPA: glycosyltransferase family 4 protein [Solirubrobacteraceae bacterium]|jgi:glycosyltransferase involved in cell wall biosynthesis
MRIAWTGPVGEEGGVPSMGRLMLFELLRQGVEVDLYMPLVGAGLPALERLPNLRIIESRSRWQWGRWYSRTKALALFSGLTARTLTYCVLNVRLVREHRRAPYDAVYQLSQTELFLLGRFRRLTPPIAVHPCTHHAGELRWHRIEERYALYSERRAVHMLMRALLRLRARAQPKELARADLVLGLSERFNELLHQDYGVPTEKLGVVRTAVDLERFTPDGQRPPADAKRTLLFVSRISSRKGVEEIIQLSHRLDDLADSVRLLVIGGATLWSDYTKHLRRLNPRVAEYRGHIPSSDLASLMRSASMLLVPSPYEPGSIATAEALACGSPVVLSTEVGNSEVVSGPHAAFHRPGDVGGLELAVREMLVRLDGDEAGLRAGARANAEAAFAPPVVVGELVRLLSALVASPATPLSDTDSGGGLVPAAEAIPLAAEPSVRHG